MRSYLTLSGVVFAVVALVQLSRLVVQFPVQVGSFTVPLWPSVIALLISGSLAIWAFRLRARVAGFDSPER